MLLLGLHFPLAKPARGRVPSCTRSPQAALAATAFLLEFGNVPRRGANKKISSGQKLGLCGPFGTGRFLCNMRSGREILYDSRFAEKAQVGALEGRSGESRRRRGNRMTRRITLDAEKTSLSRGFWCPRTEWTDPARLRLFDRIIQECRRFVNSRYAGGRGRRGWRNMESLRRSARKGVAWERPG